MFGKEKKETRFEILLNETVKGYGVWIYRDKKTGVQYLATMIGNGAGLTPLLDKDGKPIVDDCTK